MRQVFDLPDLGEGLTESEVLSWRVEEGQKVALNEVLGEVETAKAVVELPSPFAGVVTSLHAGPGDVVRVGSPLVTFEVADTAAAPGRTPTLVGYGAAAEGGGGRRRRRGLLTAQRPAGDPVLGAPVSGVPVSGDPVPDAAGPGPARSERPRSTPPVRKLARDAGLDLVALRGTGPNGLVTRADVEAAIAAASAPTAGQTTGPATPAPSGTEEAGGVGQGEARTLRGLPRSSEVPVRGVRRATAAAMVASVREQPQVTEFLTVDVTASMELLERLRGEREFSGVRLTPLSLVAKAVCLGLEREPALNARWAGENIVMQGFVNLGIAVASERGLVVPNVKDAQAMDLAALAAAIGELAGTAREGRTAPAALSGGTFTITNVGVFGVDAGTPILSPGESGILAMGRVRRQPWEHRGEVALRDLMTLALTFDHRVVDGAEGSRFLAAVGAILQDPGRTITLV